MKIRTLLPQMELRALATKCPEWRKKGADRVWGSTVKQTLKRRRPGFNEVFYGFRSFGDLLQEAGDRGVMELESDERSGGYVIRAVQREE